MKKTDFVKLSNGSESVKIRVPSHDLPVLSVMLGLTDQNAPPYKDHYTRETVRHIEIPSLTDTELSKMASSVLDLAAKTFERSKQQ